MTKAEVIDLVNEKLRIGNVILSGRKLATVENPKINWNLRGTTAGKAAISPWSGAILWFHQVYMEQEAEYANTVIHEVAHLIAMRLGDHGHGHIWKGICHLLGGNGKRCHRYTALKAKKMEKGTAFHCACMTHYLSPLKTKRTLHEGTEYFCRHCHQKLTIGEKVKVCA